MGPSVSGRSVPHAERGRQAVVCRLSPPFNDLRSHLRLGHDVKNAETQALNRMSLRDSLGEEIKKVMEAEYALRDLSCCTEIHGADRAGSTTRRGVCSGRHVPCPCVQSSPAACKRMLEQRSREPLQTQRMVANGVGRCTSQFSAGGVDSFCCHAARMSVFF